MARDLTVEFTFTNVHGRKGVSYPVVISDWRVECHSGSWDVLRVFFTAFRTAAVAEEFAEIVYADEPWVRHVDMSHARVDGGSPYVKIFSPMSAAFIEIPLQQFRALTREWLLFLEDRSERKVTFAAAV